MRELAGMGQGSMTTFGCTFTERPSELSSAILPPAMCRKRLPFSAMWAGSMALMPKSMGSLQGPVG